jgi:hypothetical protein
MRGRYLIYAPVESARDEGVLMPLAGGSRRLGIEDCGFFRRSTQKTSMPEILSIQTTNQRAIAATTR